MLYVARIEIRSLIDRWLGDWLIALLGTSSTVELVGSL
jgi:hypothetical protein